MKLGAIVMAAGLGTRMKSETPKVLHRLAGRPLLFYTIDLLLKAKVQKIAIVVCHKKERIVEAVCKEYGATSHITFVDQKKPKGTGHAILVTKPLFHRFDGALAVLSGDCPLLTPETFSQFIAEHQRKKCELTFATAHLPKETPYGRVIRDSKGEVLRIVETIDASKKEREITEMNVGLYCVNAKALFPTLEQLSSNNKKGEYYLTDIIERIVRRQACLVAHPIEVMGINNRFELHDKERYVREMICKEWMLKGVTIEDAQTTYISKGVKLSQDVTLSPQVHLEGKTTISSGASVGIGSIIRNSHIGKNVQIKDYCIIEDSTIEEGAIVGPFARLRPESLVKKRARVGNFVELKKTTLGEGSKANHLSYLGDATIGKDVNIGCGVITCNYDGGLRYKRKAKTVIGDKSFIGSDSQLIAPIHLKKGTYVASGATVTRSTPEDSLVIARADQVIKKGYMKKLWKRAKKGKK